MMQQYLETKKEHPDCIVFYRLGDFYEMFFDDAKTVSKELDLTLTGKSCGLDERAPMCGVPYHAVDSYLSRLITKGYKVAICEQMEDPALVKGIVRREVVRIVTPGTNLDLAALDETKNNYLACVTYAMNRFSLAVADITTGEFSVTEVENAENLLDEMCKLQPTELICDETFYLSGFNIDELKERLNIVVNTIDSWYTDDRLCVDALCDHFGVNSIEALGLNSSDGRIMAAGGLMLYLKETQKQDLAHILNLNVYQNGKYMLLDSATRRNLELCETIREKEKKGSLLWVLDKTRTAMGARTLRKFVEQPLVDAKLINARLDCVEEFYLGAIFREELKEYLAPVYDLERLLGKISYKSANPRDILAIASSLSMLPHIKVLLSDAKSPLLQDMYERFDTLEDIYSMIRGAINEEAPMAMKEGGIINDGFNEEVDRLRLAKTDGKDWLMELETIEKNKTGIPSLRIRFNRVFGYYIEITNTYKDKVPDDYIRKQTLSNAERYTIPKLKELEETILGAQDRLYALEYELYCEIRDNIEKEAGRILASAKDLAILDALSSLAFVAEKNNYVRPKLNSNDTIEIKDGRHPVVELMIPNRLFVANDTFLNGKKNRISIITGPNMAGKSTYMRQSALISLMAQIGSFVPAKSADLCLVDRIFTRVGASDDLASGKSTFMVEMTEVANILRNATSKSLLILDEIGRGTSTFDGLSIAWAVVEFISKGRLCGAKTLFATHYHELTELEGKIDGVNNYCIAVKENGEDIVFLRKIVKGGADKSYGIQVAKLAGVPKEVIERAKDIVEELSGADIVAGVKNLTVQNNITKKKARKFDEVDMAQMSLMDVVKDDDILNELKELDISNLTPLEALNTLNRFQNKLKNRW
ncbi:MAG: DNA mismatch repair protein MutS [Lachnospiraceae bacterium]|jgi:DNA mismatch repair protein MutS|nr:DNA mismatch repair protein MutS [Lachnospiraceae bacterium]